MTFPTTADLPGGLCEYDQWVCWDERPTGKDGKPRKVPIQAGTGQFASTTNPDTWTSFEAAREFAVNGDVAGLGFVFTDDDPFVGVDLDDAREPESDEPEEWADSIIDTLDSYTEISPSGTGYHVIIEGDLPPGRNRRGTVECYETARFFTVTGDRVDRTPDTIRSRNEALADVYSTHVDDSESERDADESDASPNEEGQDPDDPDDKPDTTLTDEELLERARAAGNSEKFDQLWNGNIQGYDSHSEADMALACLLAFWTGGDTTQMDRLFRQSDLIREKWDDVHYADGQTYGETTLARAASVTTDHYSAGGEAESNRPVANSEDTHTDSPITRAVANSGVDSLHERERARIETIATLERRLRKLDEENDRLRAERDLARANLRTLEDQLESNLDSKSEGFFARLRRFFK